jgi:3-oxoacyl-[acyl-carrier protein] reductase
MDLSWEDFEGKLVKEMRAAFFLSQAVVPLMTANQWGRLIFISSEHGHGPIAPDMISLGSAKASRNVFARFLAHELGRCGITANVISSGLMETASTKNFLPNFASTSSMPSRSAGLRRRQMLLTPCAFFAGDESRYVTGVEIPVSGGFGISHMTPPNPAPVS